MHNQVSCHKPLVILIGTSYLLLFVYAWPEGMLNRWEFNYIMVFMGAFAHSVSHCASRKNPLVPNMSIGCLRSDRGSCCVWQVQHARWSVQNEWVADRMANVLSGRMLGLLSLKTILHSYDITIVCSYGYVIL